MIIRSDEQWLIRNNSKGYKSLWRYNTSWYIWCLYEGNLGQLHKQRMLDWNDKEYFDLVVEICIIVSDDDKHEVDCDCVDCKLTGMNKLKQTVLLNCSL